ncbi:MAG: signal transduction histidine kinase [Porticoccaceae bacterium]|jgi:signal transduction histidine kinase
MSSTNPAKLANFYQSCRRVPSLQEALFLLALSAIGVFGNYLNFELFFGVNFIFGSIATMLAVRVSGTLLGTVVGIIIGSYTYVLWGHPYAIIIFGLEALVVGFLASWFDEDSMILSDVAYWLLIGVPLVGVFYFYALGLPAPVVGTIATKQMANGITNVILACLVIQFTPVKRLANLYRAGSDVHDVSMYAVINTFLAAFILLPLLILTIISGNGELDKVEKNQALTVKSMAHNAQMQVASALGHYSNILASMSLTGLGQSDLKSSGKTVAGFEKNLIPGFINTALLNSDGEILFSYPEGLSGVSEHASQLSSIKPGALYSSSGSVVGSSLTIIAPTSEGMFIESSYTPRVFDNLLYRITLGGQHAQLSDGQGNVVASAGAKDLSEFVQDINPNLLLPPNTQLSVISRAKQSYWFDTVPLLEGSSWIIRVANPLAKSIQVMQTEYMERFLTMLIIVVLSLLCVPFVAKFLSKPLAGLTHAAEALTVDVSRTDVAWPKSDIKETNALIIHFREFVRTINENQRKLDKNQELNKLRDEQDLLREETDKAKSEFISTVSHELRTPLTAIKGALGLIQAGVFDDTPEKIPPMINLAYTSAERLHVLIDDILDIERLNVGKMNFHMESVDVSSLLEEAALSIESYGRQYGVTFLFAGTDERLLVNGDHHRLIQVMANLLSNAAKFSHRDGQVDLSVRRHDGSIRVSVQDYGCGIPESSRASIFENFTQVDSSDERSKGGSGLGLGIAKNIVEAHNGEISFISEVDKGSTFTVWLPIVNRSNDL